MTTELNPLTLSLQGRQLIEASAGTGKTYNITRLYIRLLLETEHQVHNILVMTFTNAATQELRLRLDAEIRRALAQWQTGANVTDPFYQALVAQYSATQATLKLQRALQNLDEAAVFTIHGFCKRVLADQAFESGLRFDAGIDTDLDMLYLQAVQDWYRRIAMHDGFADIAASWPNPDVFYNAFKRAIKGVETLLLPYGDTDFSPIDWKASWAVEREGFIAKQVAKRRSESIKAQWQSYVDQLDAFAESSNATDPQVEPQCLVQLYSEAYFKDAKKCEAYATLFAASALAAASHERERAAFVAEGILWCRATVIDNKQRQNVMDFDDLIQVLSQQLSPGPQGDRLADAIAAQYPIALVDEFQDTDTLQYGIFDRVSRSANAQLLVMIGDPKQAIYGFRGGDVFAYLQARNSADAQWHMSTNYRSVPGVVSGYNRLFSGNRFDFGIDYHPVHAAVSDALNLVDPDCADPMQWVVFEGEDANKDAMRHLADWTVDEIVRLIAHARIPLDQSPTESHALQASDIAILVSNRDEAAFIKSALKYRGIDSVYLSNRETIWSSLQAQQFLIFLKGVDQPEDHRAMTAALATHWFGLSAVQLHQLTIDDNYHSSWRLQLEKLREHWQRHGLLSMAFKVVQRYYQPHVEQPDRQLTNDLQLLELAQQESGNKADSRELILWLSQQLALVANTSELRLESDAALIRIVTLHGAKGLEYPVVFLPFVSYGKDRRFGKDVVAIHNVVDQSSDMVVSPDKTQLMRAQRELDAELVRLLYVAATRAKQRLYVLAAPFKKIAQSPLGLLLGIRTGSDLVDRVTSMDVGAVQQLALPFVSTGNRLVAADMPPIVAARPFTGRIERDWWLSSFTALTRNVRHEGLSQPERDNDAAPLGTFEQADTAATPSIRFRLQKGAQAGNLLHDILEHLDFEAPNWESANQRMALQYGHILNTACPDGDLTEFNGWMDDILATPLDAGGLSLNQLSSAQVLRETEFYFPMSMSLNHRQHLSTFLENRRQQPVLLPNEHRLKGMMHGFIDVIFEYNGRYYLADYKSNWLGEQMADYHRSAMTESVHLHFYDLQYWIYLLALHRYCRISVPNYDPETHLGGVYYLFLRGMAPTNGTGVYFYAPDVSALHELDQLFRGDSSIDDVPIAKQYQPTGPVQ